MDQKGNWEMSQMHVVLLHIQETRTLSQMSFLLGGKYEEVNPSQKRKKLDNPDAAAACKLSNNSLFLVKVTTRDDRTFCLVSDESRLCYFKACKNFRSLTVASGQRNLDKFSCPHLEKLSGTVSAMEEYNLTAELVSDYPGGSDIQSQLMAAVEHAKQLGVSQVVRVSETSYSVCGIPDTTAEIGFVHVQKINGSFMCSVKHCRVLSGGKQPKTCHVCLHVHLLSCCLGLWKAPLEASATVTQSCSVTNSASHSSVATSTLTSFTSTTVNSSITSVPTSETSSLSRTSTI